MFSDTLLHHYYLLLEIFEDSIIENMYKNLRGLRDGDTIATKGLLSLLSQENIKFTGWAMDNAAKNGHLEIVKWLHKNRTEGCSHYALDGAARNGHLRIIKWLVENRGEDWIWSSKPDPPCRGPEIRRPKLEEWELLPMQASRVKHAMNIAAENGHTEIVNLLREKYNL